MDSTDFIMAGFFLFVIVLFVSMFAFFAYDSQQNGKIGVACVAAGHEWKQVRGDEYECVVPKR